MNDLFIGIDQIILYENGKFYLELEVGGLKGTYELKNDTITFKYNKPKPTNWRGKMIMKDGYFRSLEEDSLNIKIKKDK